MSVILINDSTMTEIADAIREKDSSSTKMLPSEMAGKIQSISTGNKRLIVSNITGNDNKSSSLTVNGTGYLMVSNTNGISKIKIDNQSVTNKFICVDDFNPNDFKLLFQQSCVIPPSNYESSSRRSYNIAVLGEYTAEQLDGNPTLIYMGQSATEGVNISGKGYVIFSGSDHQYGITRIPASIIIDGNVVTNSSVVINETPIRVDFNKSFYLPASSESFNVTAYVWN